MLKRGRAAAAQPSAGSEGVKKGEAEQPRGRAVARGKVVGPRHGRVVPGPRTKGWDAAVLELRVGGTGLDAWVRVQGHPEMAAGGGTWTWSLLVVQC